MNTIRVLVDSFADEDLLNAQMGNAREIMSRLGARFHVSTFCVGKPDARLMQRPATRLIQLPLRHQTLRILREFLFGRHHILFYLKGSPAAIAYLAMRPKWLDKRIVVATVESQSNFRVESTITPEMVRSWKRSTLRADILFSNSSNVQASLEREHGVRSEIVPTGVDTKFFAPAWNRPANRRLRVLFVGSLRPFKGPEVLLQAAVRFPEAQFVIVGDGVMEPELRERARREGLQNVIFAGSLKPSALLEEYRRADIFLFPSRWEGSPKVIMEAAASGLPVIARSDYKPETVVDRTTGLLGSSDEELLDHLTTLLSNAEMRKTMGRAGRAHVECFDWDVITRQWEEIFVRLVQERRDVTRQ